jgi:predicted RNA-binding Zn-ribbon protein involved in translation (DUF1610 family)
MKKLVCPKCGHDRLRLLTEVREVYVSEAGISFIADDYGLNREAGFVCPECDEPNDGFEGRWTVQCKVIEHSQIIDFHGSETPAKATGLSNVDSTARKSTKASLAYAFRGQK